MKPIEILGLIEEAAGTSLYQHKREQALNHIKKKDMKLAEIENILSTDVNPKLHTLQKEKNLLDEYKSDKSRLETTERVLVAFKYHEFAKLAEDPAQGDKLKNQEVQLGQKIQKIQSDFTQQEQKITNMEKSHEK